MKTNLINRHGIKLTFLAYLSVIAFAFIIGVAVNMGYGEEVSTIASAVALLVTTWMAFIYRKPRMGVVTAYSISLLWLISLVCFVGAIL